MQLNMSFFINFFKSLFSSETKGETPEVKPAAIKRSLPSTPINPMVDEVENSNTVTHDLIHEIEKNKHIQDEGADKVQETSVEEQTVVVPIPLVENESKAEAEIAVKNKEEAKATIAPEPLPVVEVLETVKPVEQTPSTISIEPTASEPEKVESVAKASVTKEAEAKAKPAVKTVVTKEAKPKPVSKTAVNKEAKPKPAAKTAVNKEAKPKPAAKAKVKSTTNVIPKTIVLDEVASSLTTKSKRIVGHSKSHPESFIVTHIVKSEQDKLRLNLTLTAWKNVEGLSFVTYDIANDGIVFSKKCDDKIASKLNDVLLSWARDLNKKYYT